MNTPTANPVMRQHAEVQYAEELAELRKLDERPRPENWQLSPWAAVRYLMGGKLDNGFEVSPKYIGSPRLMEIAVATLATDAGRLGVPDDARDKLRDALLELARQFEAKSPQWVALQKAITVSMEHPEVARRLMPVVLPWMHRAA